MRLNELVEDGGHVFYLQGEIDLHYSPVLRSLCQSKIKARCPVLILDLSEVDYIDSTGLAVVMEYFRDTAEYGGILCLTGLNEKLKTIFEIVGLDRGTKPTLDEVLRRVHPEDLAFVQDTLGHATREGEALVPEVDSVTPSSPVGTVVMPDRRISSWVIT